MVAASLEALKYLMNFHPVLNDSRDRGDSWANKAVLIQTVMRIMNNVEIDVLFI